MQHISVIPADTWLLRSTETI